MIHLALPRDLVVPIFVGWVWLGWRLDLGFWIGPGLRVRPGGTGWGAYGVVTIFAAVLCWLCVFVSPYWWL